MFILLCVGDRFIGHVSECVQRIVRGHLACSHFHTCKCCNLRRRSRPAGQRYAVSVEHSNLLDVCRFRLSHLFLLLSRSIRGQFRFFQLILVAIPHEPASATEQHDDDQCYSYLNKGNIAAGLDGSSRLNLDEVVDRLVQSSIVMHSHDHPDGS